jgi:hypothetical protein
MALRHLVPKRSRSLLATALIAAAVVTGYELVRLRGPWLPGRPAGLLLGTVAAMIVLVDGLYPLRRRLGRWPFASAERWLQFHIYAGTLAALFAALHVGVRWPHGRLGWLLVVTGGWSVASGLFGVLLQKLLPATLGTELSVEATYEHLPQLATRLQAEADRLMTGAADMFERVYRADIQPTLVGIQPSWSYLLDVGTAKQARLEPLHGLEAFVTESERARLDELVSIVSEKLQLDIQYSLQRALRHWLTLHVPVAYLFMGLLVLHVWLVLTF